VAIPIALVLPVVAFALYVLVAMLWVVPDRRFDQKPNEAGPTG